MKLLQMRKEENPQLQINAQNCVHCKTCDIKDTSKISIGLYQRVEGDQITQTCKEICDGKSMVPETVKHIIIAARRYLSSFSFALLLLNSCTTENSLDIHANVPSTSNAGNYLTGRVAYNNHDLNDATSSFRDALKKSERGLVTTTGFIAELEAGNLDHAIKLAERALKQKKTSIFMHLVIGLRDVKGKLGQSAR